MNKICYGCFEKPVVRGVDIEIMDNYGHERLFCSMECLAKYMEDDKMCTRRSNFLKGFDVCYSDREYMSSPVAEKFYEIKKIYKIKRLRDFAGVSDEGVLSVPGIGVSFLKEFRRIINIYISKYISRKRIPSVYDSGASLV